MNAFDMGSLPMMAFSNPELFSSAMASMGVSPGGMMAQNGLVPPGMDQMDPLAGFMTPSLSAQGGGPVSPAMVAPGGAPAAAAGPDIMQMLGQVKTPAPVAPIMSAGVSGSQKAPEMQVGQQNSAIQQAVMKLLMNPAASGAPQVPGLAGLMRGVA